MVLTHYGYIDYPVINTCMHMQAWPLLCRKTSFRFEVQSTVVFLSVGFAAQ